MNYLLIIPRILKLETLGPESRWFLIKFMPYCSVDRPIDIKKHELAKILGISVRRLSKAVDALVEEKYLIKEKVYQVGRPYGRYCFSPKFLNLISSDVEQVETCHVHLIDSLIVMPSRAGLLNVKHALSECERLLLTVLLLHANAGGVVDSLGLSDLSILTGMKRGRIKALLKQLREFGYIRAYVSGLSGSCLFCVAKSIYFLNLKHRAFGAKASGGRVYFCIGSGSGAESSDIFKCAREIRKNGGQKRSIQSQESTFEKVHEYFYESKKVGMVDYLQAKLEFYASYLLSNHWKNIPEKSSFNCDSEDTWADLVNRIRSEISANGIIKGKDIDPLPTEGKKELLYEFLCWQAIEIAKLVKEVIRLDPKFHSESLQYSILPGIKGGNGFSYIVDCSDSDIKNGKSEFFVIDPSKVSKPTIKVELAEADQFQFGMPKIATSRQNNQFRLETNSFYCKLPLPVSSK